MTDDELRNLNPWAYELKYGNVLVLPTLLTSVEAARLKFIKDTYECYVSYKVNRDCTGLVIPFGLLRVEAYCAALDMCAAFFVEIKRYIVLVTVFGFVIDLDTDIYVGMIA